MIICEILSTKQNFSFRFVSHLKISSLSWSKVFSRESGSTYRNHFLRRRYMDLRMFRTFLSSNSAFSLFSSSRSALRIILAGFVRMSSTALRLQAFFIESKASFPGGIRSCEWLFILQLFEITVSPLLVLIVELHFFVTHLHETLPSCIIRCRLYLKPSTITHGTPLFFSIFLRLILLWKMHSQDWLE